VGSHACGLLQFKGMNKALDVWPIPAVGRSPSSLPDHPVWKSSEPAVALGLLEVISAAHVLNPHLTCSLAEPINATSRRNSIVI